VIFKSLFWKPVILHSLKVFNQVFIFISYFMNS
jgi:hypothetical protein